MSESFLTELDVKSLKTHTQYSPRDLFYNKSIYVSLSASEDAVEFLSNTVGLYDTVLNVTTFRSVDDIITLLDAGASRVFVTSEQRAQLQHIENVDPRRTILSINVSELEVPSADIPLHLSGVSDIQVIEKYLNQRKLDVAPLYISLTQSSSSKVLALAKRAVIPIVAANLLSLDLNATGDPINVSDLLLANAKSDRPDGLFTTLVTDEQAIALGLVYSSSQSIAESLRTGGGVYQSRKRGLWYKGESSGDTQELLNVAFDCDHDCFRFTVRQKGRGFCHLATATCYGQYRGLARLQQTLQERKTSAPPGSYTARLFSDPKLLNAKIKEEADELCEADTPNNIAFETADLLYFALTKCIAAGVSLGDVERSLDIKSTKVKRRKGDAKAPYVVTESTTNGKVSNEISETTKEAASVPKGKTDPAGLDENARIRMTRYVTSRDAPENIAEALKRPSQRSTETIMGIVKPIIEDVRQNGDRALLAYTQKFEKATSLKSPVLHAPFPKELMQLPSETIEAIDISFNNIKMFHSAQKEDKPLVVETMPGVVCSRFSRPIERVGLYVPGGTAVLPSTALMLGVPALVAGCKKIVLASPPRADGSITPEIVYAAHKVGAESIVLAGGAQAVAAMAYGTESVSKVDKILGPGNQFVTAGKMLVSNDTSASVSIDMPAGPSEVLVIADKTSNPAFVAADLLSQAEHGTDSQVILIAVDMTETELLAVEDELHKQAMALPRVDIVRGAIDHSITLVVRDIEEALHLSNQYAPEHLIIQVADAEAAAAMVENAGSVFIGPWTPESVGDYSAGVNHSLPTYGYARQYSGVNLGSYVKHITSSKLTEEGLRNVGGAVMQLAKVEELEAHRRAVSIRLAQMGIA